MILFRQYAELNYHFSFSIIQLGLVQISVYGVLINISLRDTTLYTRPKRYF